jgi:predicted phosphodiesterase
LILLTVAAAVAAGASISERQETFSALFDGAAKPRGALGSFGAGAPQAPRPRSPAEDLDKAHARWGNAAQAKLLASLHPQPKESFTIAVIGDAEPGRFPWERVFSPGEHAYERLMAAIKARAPDLIFQLGDMVSKGTEDNYRAHLKSLQENAGAPIFSVIGNHDRSAPNGQADKNLYHQVFGPGDFYVDYNGWRLVGLDTADRRLKPEQIEWLKRVLEPGRRMIVFTHVPPAFLKGRLNTCTVPQSKPGDYIHDVLTGYFEEGASEFDDLMAERKVERVYVGHLHAFGMAERRGTRYVLSGAGGSPLYPLPATEPQCLFAHWVQVELGAGAIRETVHTLDGRQFPLPNQFGEAIPAPAARQRFGVP